MHRVRRNLRFVVTGFLIIAFVIALSLFVDGFSAGSGSSPVAGPAVGSSTGAGLGAGTPAPTPTPSATPSRTGAAAAAIAAPTKLPRYTFTPAEPGGFTYVNLPTHSLVLEATSASPISGVAYLIPTSADDSYGKALKVGTAWSLRTSVVGKPYYAALFVQAGAAGVPITCTIVLDGRVASKLTTSGAYGRQVCVA
jgi:hypothetical protein